ncbi:MAG: family oxidoreductase [Paenibacillus sp.]|jgi:NAD(P)-dependent dehydrogenase (short-subunit alcohol dehydrogenase family)|nr:family oxidoreductase [Paenibacillus sp.]
MSEAQEGKEQFLQRLKGKVALVTGGGSGIGKASALLYAKHGAKVCILNRSLEPANEVQDEIIRSGGEAFAVGADISHPEEMLQAVDEVILRYGRLDIVFANAGVNGVLNAIEHMNVQDWEQTVDINLKGTFLTVKYAVPHLKKRGGSIIITSSINGNRVFSNFGFSTYSTTKAGQVAFMKMAALELARYRIRVNAVCPGAINTNIDENTHRMPEVDEIRIPVEFPEGDHPLERKPGSAEQVADLALFLASDESSHISGSEIYIDGAESLLRG